MDYTVKSGVYDEEYYKTMRGADDFSSNAVSLFYKSFLSRLDDSIKGKVVLDVGCGRGELIQLLLERGAAFVYGVDFSYASMKISKDYLERCGMDASRYKLICADISIFNRDFEGKFDYIFMLDVIEHLQPKDLERALLNSSKYLKAEGELHYHTFPTRLPHAIFMNMLMVIAPLKKRDIENIHVNVQNRRSLVQLLQKSGMRVSSTYLKNDILLTSSFYLNMGEGVFKKIIKVIFGDLPSLSAFRKIVKILGLEEVFFMSIYGIAKTDNLQRK